MLVSNLIAMSLRKVGALSSGEVIEATRQDEALQALQVMLRSWGALGINIFSTTRETFTLTGGIGEYTWGTGGDIATPRPVQITSAYVVETDGSSSNIEIISENQFNDFKSKTATGQPIYIYLYTSFPLAKIYFLPVPESAYTVTLVSFKPFVETGSFALVTDEIDFPLYYEEPIVYNLAVRLAAEYGRTVSADIAAFAQMGYNTLVNANSSGRNGIVSFDFPTANTVLY
jgi:hypothetical protein